MTHCTKAYKAAMVDRYLSSGLSLREFSDQEGVAKSSLYTWSRKLKATTVYAMKKVSFTPEQRFAMVLETALFTETELSHYCREKGLHPVHLQQWKAACIGATGEQSKSLTPEDKQDKKRIKVLEKELRRKEKALAETAALLVLRKKFNALYGLDEEQ